MCRGASTSLTGHPPAFLCPPALPCQESFKSKAENLPRRSRDSFQAAVMTPEPPALDPSPEYIFVLALLNYVLSRFRSHLHCTLLSIISIQVPVSRGLQRAAGTSLSLPHLWGVPARREPGGKGSCPRRDAATVFDCNSRQPPTGGYEKHVAVAAVLPS